jgi:hypothetical protein
MTRMDRGFSLIIYKKISVHPRLIREIRVPLSLHPRMRQIRSTHHLADLPHPPRLCGEIVICAVE